MRHSFSGGGVGKMNIRLACSTGLAALVMVSVDGCGSTNSSYPMQVGGCGVDGYQGYKPVFVIPSNNLNCFKFISGLVNTNVPNNPINYVLTTVNGSTSLGAQAVISDDDNDLTHHPEQ